MKIYFVRHGETQRGANGTYGYSAPLTDLGRKQAELTGDCMAELGITKIVSSDAVRAMQTAEPLQKVLDIEVDLISELIEIDIGAPSDGVTPFRENRNADGFHVMDFGHFGGESWDIFYSRVSRGLTLLAEKFAHTDVLAVFTHGGVKSIAIDHYSGRKPTGVMHTLYHNGSISAVELLDSGHVVRSRNDVAHLESILR